jgi:transposase
VFVLATGIAWAHLSRELRCSGTTAWRRLRDWQAGGAWERLHKTLLDKAQRRGRDRLVGLGGRRQPHPLSFVVLLVGRTFWTRHRRRA